MGKIEGLENKVRGNKLSHLAGIIKRIISFETAPCFIMGYLACEEGTFKEAFDYIRKNLSIPKNNVKEVELKKEMSDLRDYFLGNIAEFNALEGEIVIVKAEGFEKLGRLELNWHIDGNRTAHDYDQDVIENQKIDYKDLRKKVIVITHIGYSKGKEGFKNAASSAEMSQFKHFVYEF